MWEGFFIIKINFAADLVLRGHGFCFVKIVERIELACELKLRLDPCLDLSEYSLTSFTINSESKNLNDQLIFCVTCLSPVTQSILQLLSTICVI